MLLACIIARSIIVPLWWSLPISKSKYIVSDELLQKISALNLRDFFWNQTLDFRIYSQLVNWMQLRPIEIAYPKLYKLHELSSFHPNIEVLIQASLVLLKMAITLKSQYGWNQGGAVFSKRKLFTVILHINKPISQMSSRCNGLTT